MSRFSEKGYHVKENAPVYFTRDMDRTAKWFEYVHDVIEYGWGQRVIRFYDPDSHIIEVGEDMEMVVRRFKNAGMTDWQVADRMKVPLEYVQGYLYK